MLKKRLLTAIILLPIVVVAIITLPIVMFNFFAAWIIVLAAWEWAGLMKWEKLALRLAYCAFLAGLLWLSVYIPPVTWYRIAVAWWLVALFCVWRFPSFTTFWGRGPWVRGIMGALTLVPCWVALTHIRDNPNGIYELFILLVLIWVADSAAYFSGKRFGKNKLAPNVSPGKTLEGLVGALAGGLILGIASLLIVNLFPVQRWWWVALFEVTVLVSVLGDLSESMLKRFSDVKDSGTMLPGHGGILDRIDSLTAAAPIFALGLYYLGLLK